MTGKRLSLIPMFGIASLIAVLAGCWAAAAAGAAVVIWGGMIAAWLVGLGIALALERSGPIGDRTAGSIAIATICVLLLCFADDGLQGVHRWVVIGPIRINAAAIVMPLLLIVLAGRVWAPPVLTIVMMILVGQPDASQATAVAIAAVPLLLPGSRRRSSLAWLAVFAVLAITAWLRPDPLASVPNVEGIVELAWNMAPIVAIVALAALAIVGGAPLLSDIGSASPAASALSTYMLATAIAPAIGAFPVPLIGMSMSPVIGFWLGIGALASQRRAQ